MGGGPYIKTYDIKINWAPLGLFIGVLFADTETNIIL